MDSETKNYGSKRVTHMGDPFMKVFINYCNCTISTTVTMSWFTHIMDLKYGMKCSHNILIIAFSVLTTLECAFEQDMCSFITDQNEDLTWKLHQDVAEGHTKPINDHTTRTGKCRLYFRLPITLWELRHCWVERRDCQWYPKMVWDNGIRQTSSTFWIAIPYPSWLNLK